MPQNNGQPGRRARFEFDDVLLDAENYRIVKAGQTRPVGPRAFDVLLYLLAHPGRVVEKRELIETVWQGVSVTDNALTRAIKEVRAAIGDDAAAPRYVQTIPRRGYRFAAPLRTVGPEPRITLVVLPFSDLSRHPDASFRDGMLEEMTTQIARLNAARLAVIARSSATTCRNTGQSIVDIARELHADYVLDGSVRRERGRVRITAQLIESASQSHVWADSFDEDLGDVLRAQARAAEAVARAVRVEVPPEARRGKPIQSLDPEAYAAHLEGRYRWSRRAAGDSIAAMRAFQRAIRLEPTFAPPYAGLARCCCTFAIGLLPRRDAEPMARAAVLRSLELDDRLAEAHATLGALESFAGNHAEAERAFRRALALDPHDAAARHWYAMHCLVDRGRFDEALAELRLAQSLDPLALIVSADVAAVYCMRRDFDRALTQCQRVLQLDPAFARAHLYAGWVHAHRGEADQAVAAFEAAGRLDDSPWAAAWLGYGYGLAKRRLEAGRVLARLKASSAEGCEVAFFDALVYAGLKDHARALDSLDRACAERSLAFSVAAHLPAFEDLRHDPRFQHVLRRYAQRAAADTEAAAPEEGHS